MKISAVVITFNEEKNIGRCMASLAGVVEEIIVVDSLSTDQTPAICRAAGVKFFQRAWTGYGDQKNWGAEQAANDFIFSIDADEALDERLRNSLIALDPPSALDAWEMNRLTSYCGRWIHHSGWYPDRKIRLYNRYKMRWDEREVHEKLEATGAVRTGFLKGNLLHYSYYTKEEHFNRVRKYGQMAAMASLEMRGAWWRSRISPAIKFLRNYLLKLGFLDGREGFWVCYGAALETYWKYTYLRRLQREEASGQ